MRHIPVEVELEKQTVLGCAFHAVYSALYNCRRRAKVHTVYFYKESNFGKGFGFGKGYGFLFLVKASDSLFWFCA